FTRNKTNTIVYALALGWPKEPILIRSLGTGAVTRPAAVAHVERWGSEARPQWQQTADGRRGDVSRISPATDFAAALRAALAVQDPAVGEGLTASARVAYRAASIERERTP